MIFNIITAGFKATITVHTAAGATVTCVLSPFSYTATADSSGVAVFTVFGRGNWTVTASKNSVTATATADMQTPLENRVIDLPLRYYIFKSGTGVIVPIYYRTGSNNLAITGTNSFQFLYQSVSVSGHTIRKDLAITANNKINLSNFSKFVVEAVHNSSGHELWMIAKSNLSDSTNNSIINKFTCMTRTTVTYNISSLTGNKYVGLYNGSSVGATCYNWYFEV